jgi:hypothetical protein
LANESDEIVASLLASLKTNFRCVILARRGLLSWEVSVDGDSVGSQVVACLLTCTGLLLVLDHIHKFEFRYGLMDVSYVPGACRDVCHVTARRQLRNQKTHMSQLNLEPGDIQITSECGSRRSATRRQPHLAKPRDTIGVAPTPACSFVACSNSELAVLTSKATTWWVGVAASTRAHTKCPSLHDYT